MPALPAVLTRKLVVLLAVAVVAVGGFESYGAYTRSKPVDYARGGHAFAAPPSPSGTAQPLAATTPPEPTATPTAAAASAAPRPATRVPTVAPTTALPPTAARGPRPTPTTGLAVPRTGSYQLAIDGSEKVTFGVVSFCHQQLPTRSALVVSKAVGESPGSYDFDLRYFPGKAGQHDERHIYRYTPAAVFLDYEIATVTCQGIRQSSDTSFAPPQLRARLPLAVGSQWANKGGDADRTETSTSRVLRTETLTVAGSQVPTYVITTTTTFTGGEHGSRSQTWWYSPSWAMPVKWTEQITGKRSGAAYSEHVTVSVRSRP